MCCEKRNLIFNFPNFLYWFSGFLIKKKKKKIKIITVNGNSNGTVTKLNTKLWIESNWKLED